MLRTGFFFVLLLVVFLSFTQLLFACFVQRQLRMATSCELNNEEITPEGKTEMSTFEEMLNDIRESTPLTAQTSNTSLLVEDLLIKEALDLSTVSETDVLSEETAQPENINDSNNNTSESLVEALVSTSKCFSIALNSVTPTTVIPKPAIDASTTTNTPAEPPQPPVQHIDIVQSSSVIPKPVIDASTTTTTTTLAEPPQPTVQHIDIAQTSATITTESPKKKQHIMISYNRSCENACRKLRQSLKDLKYKVWMDVYDMRDNFIDGMAKAIRNSYIVLICLNKNYDSSYWCKKEIQDVAVKRIKFIPCFMEEPFELADWLEFLVSGNIWIDFSKDDQYDKSLNQLIGEITTIEDNLSTYPRETPSPTPMLNPITTNPSSVEQSFDTIISNFKTWVEQNRSNLKQLNRKESSQLINQLIEGLQNDSQTFEDENKRDLLQQLLLSTKPNETISNFFHQFNTSNYPVMKTLIFIMALWAVRVVYQRN